jgi:hypothetical protein
MIVVSCFIAKCEGQNEGGRIRERGHWDSSPTLSLYYHLQQHLLPMSSSELSETNTRLVFCLLCRHQCYHTGREDGTKTLCMTCLSRKGISRQRNYSTSTSITDVDLKKKLWGGGRQTALLHSFVLRSWTSSRLTYRLQ